MTRRMTLVIVIVPLLSSCRESPKPHGGAPAVVAKAPPVRDSLALTTRSGAQVWFVAERPARDSAGTPCIERAMEIRWSGKITRVPLLYTGSAPRLVNDTTIEAAIWLHCRPGNVYRVDLHTGRPLRVK